MPPSVLAGSTMMTLFPSLLAATAAMTPDAVPPYTQTSATAEFAGWDWAHVVAGLAKHVSATERRKILIG